MDESHYDNLRETIRERYGNGYYIHCITITFKPATSYFICHPKKAHESFKTHFSKYLTKHKFTFIMFPEISDSGMYHLHGLIFDKTGDYNEHDKRMRLLRNYMNRSYGRHTCQHVQHLQSEGYACSMFTRRSGLVGWTSFDRIWKYITKDAERFQFLKSFSNIY